MTGTWSNELLPWQITTYEVKINAETSDLEGRQGSKGSEMYQS